MNPPQQKWSRGPVNGLHQAAFVGSVEGTLAALSMGSINIDQGNPAGFTPLILAAQEGYSRVVRILLNRGADMSIAADGGFSALHLSVRFGHLAVTLDLLKAGADPEAKSSDDATPLHLAAQLGHPRIVSALIEAGARVDVSSCYGETPLLSAAREGCLTIVKQLLHAGASTLVAATTLCGRTFLPLDVAALNGRSCVVRELVKQRGINGSGGATGGLDALKAAAKHGHVDTMAILTDAGVMDTGEVLRFAAWWGRAASVRFLLQQRQREGSPTGVLEYVNSCSRFDGTALFRSINVVPDVVCSPRTVQLLIDAGADTSSNVRLQDRGGKLGVTETPLALTNRFLRDKAVGRRDATEEQLHGLEAVRRLLLRAEAVRAASWLWHAEAPIAQGVEFGDASKAETASIPLPVTLPILRRRARRHGLVLAPLFRHSQKIGYEASCDGGKEDAFSAV